MDEAFAHLEGNNLRNNKKTEIPPDGGWGYVVCIGVGFTFTLKIDFPCTGVTEGGYQKLGDRLNEWKSPSCKGAGAPSTYRLPGEKAPALSLTPADMNSIAMDIKNLISQLASLPMLTASVKVIQLDIEELKSLRVDITDIMLLKPELYEIKTSLDFIYIYNSEELLTSRISEISLEVQE
ncbi:unnamed protein product [Euphydryas editha]|uniref:Uncharacterized protein n=1 Tax=Euphydryas editha TaxID=104508 RepID=A0AAU9TZ59_EUPED|nr:unnamed protein product [Euphydryas editha]